MAFENVNILVICIWNCYYFIKLDYEIVNIIDESFVKVCIFQENGMWNCSFFKSIWGGIVYFSGYLANEIVNIVDVSFVNMCIFQVNGMCNC